MTDFILFVMFVICPYITHQILIYQTNGQTSLKNLLLIKDKNTKYPFTRIDVFCILLSSWFVLPIIFVITTFIKLTSFVPDMIIFPLKKQK